MMSEKQKNPHNFYFNHHNYKFDTAGVFNSTLQSTLPTELPRGMMENVNNGVTAK